jgi:DNA-binding GntR family transcriptional regulator
MMAAAVSDGNEYADTPLPIPPSRTDQVYEAIIDDICSGRLTPGTPLRQELLAERFNVSRQPVQQALLLLRNQGLLREFGRRGLEVAPLDRDFVSHLYELRWLLDGQAARLAAARRTDQWVEQVTTLVETGTRALAEHSFAQSIEGDVEFHRSVLEAAGNPLLAESANVMWRNTKRVMGEVLLQGGAPAWVWDDHRAILAAIRDRDGDRAEALARRHAEHGEQLILDGMVKPQD